MSTVHEDVSHTSTNQSTDPPHLYDSGHSISVQLGLDPGGLCEQLSEASRSVTTQQVVGYILRTRGVEEAEHSKRWEIF